MLVPTREEIHKKWIPPSFSIYKVNINFVVDVGSRVFRIRIVIRNEEFI